VTISQYFITGEGNSSVDSVTYFQLRQMVELFAHKLRKLGVVTGDRIVGKRLCSINCAFLLYIELQGYS